MLKVGWKHSDLYRHIKNNTMKQETLEEAAERISKTHSVYETGQDDFEQGFIKGAKWQQETYHQFTLAMEDLKSSRDGYLKAKKEYEEKQNGYSEYDVLMILNRFKVNFMLDLERDDILTWFEQFKKK